MEPPPSAPPEPAVPLAMPTVGAEQPPPEATPERPPEATEGPQQEQEQQVEHELPVEPQHPQEEPMEEDLGSLSARSDGEHSSDHEWQGGSQPILELPELGQPQVGPKYK